MSALRVGIDVGGTFTDVVAIDAASRAIVARVKVPTTHAATEGVAAGIVAGLARVLGAPGITSEGIAFLAHSTTQATNALLEGDVARVGVVGLIDRAGAIARSQLRVPPIRLAARAVLAPETVFAPLDGEAAQRSAVDALVARGVEAIAVSAPFGVDRPVSESRIVDYVHERGLPATCGHDVSSMYGLRARTRTAILNAAILPTMMRTSQMTADAAARAGITVPLMIMRSDGGVMDVREVARRPILTMLSGPAAGIAGALLHENVTDGIFIEVGGTSADCSVIRRGLPQMRPARVGGHRTMLRTLDVRTLGIAGGSLVRIDPSATSIAGLRDVGPRSAHIAGLQYATFTAPAALRDARVIFVRPQSGDAEDHVALELTNGARCGLTPTCAANLLGYVPETAFAHGDPHSARLAFALVASRLGCEPEALARAVLEHATAKLKTAIDELVDDYELDRRTIELIGGGGGAAALVPFAAQRLGATHRIARDAEVISPIGVALALVRDVVERTIVNPTPDDVVRVRREAIERVVAAGASPELSEAVVEIDPRRNLVRATASGATAAVAHGGDALEVDLAQRIAAVAQAMHADSDGMREVGRTTGFELYAVERHSRASEWWLRFLPATGDTDIGIVDRAGVVRAIARRAHARTTRLSELGRALRTVLDEMTDFGDVGRALPDVHLVYGKRIVDMGALADPEQVVALAQEEVRGLDPATAIVIVAARRAA